MHGRGIDTHDLAVAAGKQADAAKSLADQAKAQTDKMGELIQKTSDQADATNKLAREAKRSADIARNTFNAVNRPYVGIEGIHPTYGFEPNQAGPAAPETARSMKYWVTIKNFGPLPGTKFKASWKVFRNNQELPQSSYPELPNTINPTQTVQLGGEIGGADYAGVLNRTVVLAIEVTIQYSSLTGSYKECTSHRYEPSLPAFLNLGPACS